MADLVLKNLIAHALSCIFTGICPSVCVVRVCNLRISFRMFSFLSLCNVIYLFMQIEHD